LKKLKPVLITKKEIIPGDILNIQDIEYKYIETKEITRHLLQSEEEVIGYSSKRRIKKGELLKKSLLRKIYLIKIGKEINIFYKKGNLMLKLTGIALQNGIKGDNIYIRAKDSTKKIIGKIISRTEVVVEND
jgi:flagella basal body P-ring formation protein FlgA